MPVNVIAGLAATAVGAALFVPWLPWERHRVRRRQEAVEGPPTMDLGDEPPAVVNLLVNACRLTADAVAATLLDLTAAGHLEVLQTSVDQVVIRLRHHGRRPLSESEQQLMSLVATAGGGGDVTVPALAEVLARGAPAAWSRFRGAVQREAIRRGLVEQPSIQRAVTTLLALDAVVCGGLFVISPILWLALPFVFLGLGIVGALLVRRRRELVLTDEGRVVGSHWLGVRRFLAAGNFSELPAGAVAIWDRYLGYAAAMGLSETASHGLVRELRTHLSTTQAVTTVGKFSGLHAGRGQVATPERIHAARHAEAFGPTVPVTELFGPEPSDWWELLEITGRAWPVAAIVTMYDKESWRRAASRRLALLVASAPPELASAVTALRPMAQRAIDAMTDGIRRVDQSGSLSAEEEEAVRRLTTAVATRRGWVDDPGTVLAGLAGSR